MTSVKFAQLAFAVLLCVAPAQAETPDKCATAYHDALAKLDRSTNVGAAVAAMRTPDAALPGHWLFFDRLFGKPHRRSPPVAAQVCLQSVKIYGRIRCQRFADAEASPKPPAELTIEPAPTPAELKLLKSLVDIVDGRGAVPDVGPNGRQRWLAERATSDIKNYLSQPPHPAICSGAKEVAEFYSTQLQPLVRRADAVAELAEKARALAQTRIDSALAPPVAEPGPSEAPPAAPGGDNIQPEKASATPAPISTPTPRAAPTPTPASPPKTLVDLTADAVRPVLAADAITAILAEKTPIAALTRAKAALAEVQATATAKSDQALTDKTYASGRALRMLEAAAYADIYAARFRAFKATVATVPDGIRKAHAELCTCEP